MFNNDYIKDTMIVRNTTFSVFLFPNNEIFYNYSSNNLSVEEKYFEYKKFLKEELSKNLYEDTFGPNKQNYLLLLDKGLELEIINEEEYYDELLSNESLIRSFIFNIKQKLYNKKSITEQCLTVMNLFVQFYENQEKYYKSAEVIISALQSYLEFIPKTIVFNYPTRNIMKYLNKEFLILFSSIIFRSIIDQYYNDKDFLNFITDLYTEDQQLYQFRVLLTVDFNKSILDSLSNFKQLTESKNYLMNSIDKEYIPFLKDDDLCILNDYFNENEKIIKSLTDNQSTIKGLNRLKNSINEEYNKRLNK